MDNIVAQVLAERSGTYGSFGENACFTQMRMADYGEPALEGYDRMVLKETAHMVYHKLSRLHIGGETARNEDSFVDDAGYAFVCAGHLLTSPKDWKPEGGERALFVRGSRANRAYNLVQSMMPTIFEHENRRHAGIAMTHLGLALQELV